MTSSPILAAQFMAHKPVNFASLTDSFQIFESVILNANTGNTTLLSGPRKIPGLSRKRAPGQKMGMENDIF